MSVTRGDDGRPIGFFDLPMEAFPITISAHLDGPGGKVLWEQVIEPYAMTPIPALPKELLGRIWMRLHTADGTEHWEPPMGEQRAREYIEERIEESGG